jgi:hypothetical protein
VVEICLPLLIEGKNLAGRVFIEFKPAHKFLKIESRAFGMVKQLGDFLASDQSPGLKARLYPVGHIPKRSAREGRGEEDDTACGCL